MVYGTLDCMERNQFEKPYGPELLSCSFQFLMILNIPQEKVSSMFDCMSRSLEDSSRRVYLRSRDLGCVY